MWPWKDQSSFLPTKRRRTVAWYQVADEYVPPPPLPSPGRMRTVKTAMALASAREQLPNIGTTLHSHLLNLINTVEEQHGTVGLAQKANNPEAGNRLMGWGGGGGNTPALTRTQRHSQTPKCRPKITASPQPLSHPL